MFLGHCLNGAYPAVLLEYTHIWNLNWRGFISYIFYILTVHPVKLTATMEIVAWDFDLIHIVQHLKTNAVTQN